MFNIIAYCQFIWKKSYFVESKFRNILYSHKHSKDFYFKIYARSRRYFKEINYLNIESNNAFFYLLIIIPNQISY